MDFTVEGLEFFMDEFEKGFIDDTKKEGALKKAVEPLYDSIVDSAPIRTGKLRKSFIKKVNKNRAIVSSSKRYAFILEYGSHHTVKHIGYFSDAVRNSEDKVLDVLENELLKDFD